MKIRAALFVLLTAGLMGCAESKYVEVTDSEESTGSTAYERTAPDQCANSPDLVTKSKACEQLATAYRHFPEKGIEPAFKHCAIEQAMPNPNLMECGLAWRFYREMSPDRQAFLSDVAYREMQEAINQKHSIGYLDGYRIDDNKADGYSEQYLIEIAKKSANADQAVIATAAKMNCEDHGIPASCSMAKAMGATYDQELADTSWHDTKAEQAENDEREEKNREENEEMQANMPTTADAVLQGLRNSGIPAFRNLGMVGQSAASAPTRLPAMPSARPAPSAEPSSGSDVFAGAPAKCRQYVDAAKAGSMSASYEAAACLQGNAAIAKPDSPNAAGYANGANQNYDTMKTLESK